MTDLASLPFREWKPRSRLHAASTDVPASAFPCIDVHNHLGHWTTSDGSWSAPDVDALLQLMDARNVEMIVNLDGMVGQELEDNLDRYDRVHPDRFVTFCQLDWKLFSQADGEQLLLAALEDSARRGARGLKVWKDLGLEIRDVDGALVRLDDPRVIRIIQRAGELGLPILIHSADPLAFFDPLDEYNERLDELGGWPEFWFGDRSRHPSFEDVWEAHATLVRSCPGTTIVGAHVGCYAENLDRVSELLSEAPNYHVDIAGRLAELGRQPRRFARFVADHPDRVLFGTDVFPVDEEQYRVHYRFLETDDESFEYAPAHAIPPQGRWTISGVALPEDQLRAIYRDNARRVLGLD